MRGQNRSLDFGHRLQAGRRSAQRLLPALVLSDVGNHNHGRDREFHILRSSGLKPDEQIPIQDRIVQLDLFPATGGHDLSRFQQEFVERTM